MPAPRIVRVRRLASSLIVALPGIAIIFGAQFVSRSDAFQWTLGVAIAVALVSFLAHLIQEGRLRKHASHFEGHICPRCAYPLPKQEKQARCPECPECGTTVDLQQVVKQWREFASW